MKAFDFVFADGQFAVFGFRLGLFVRFFAVRAQVCHGVHNHGDEQVEHHKGGNQDERDEKQPCVRIHFHHRADDTRIRKKPNGQAFYGARIVSIFSDGLHGLGLSEKIMAHGPAEGFSFRQTVRAATPIFAGF